MKAPLCPVTLDLARTDYPPLRPFVPVAREGGSESGYPDLTATESLLAARIGISADRVLMTAGSDDALLRIFRATLRPGTTVALTDPTFEMLPRFAAGTGALVRNIPWMDEPLTLERITPVVDETLALIALVTPNNPTGMIIQTEEICRIARAFPAVSIVVDLAYVEFADEDPTPALLALPNVIVTRTFSKAWGLAAWRLGYAIAAPDLIGAMRSAGLPYPVSRASVDQLEAVLRDSESLDALHRRVTTIRDFRQQLQQLLKALAVPMTDSKGNFVAVTGPRVPWLYQALRSLGIATRYLDSRAEIIIRITVPATVEAFAALEAALRVAMMPQALLFDLDGVLADVSQSYREAILQTVAAFGGTATGADIQQIKDLGNANDDWELTHRLLRRQGKDPSLAEVTRHFELRYQGTTDTPGLRECEVLLTAPALLARFAARVPLGVVTGRPRADAERFLCDQGIRNLFQVVIAREDAPLKPDPAPIREAMRRLGSERAWMFGDTPDDLNAARACGVIPVGVIAPGSDPLAALAALQTAGAAIVLNQLEEILPCLG